MTNKKIELDAIFGYAIILVFTLLTSIFSIYLIDKIKSLQPNVEIIEKPVIIEVEPKYKPSDYPDYEIIKGENPDPKIHATIITKDCPEDGCVNNNPASVDFDGIDKYYKIKGKFSRAYLFIEVLVDYERPLTVWDDFYFKINNLGGHLLLGDNLLAIPPGKTSRYLYDLRSISYCPSIKDKEHQENQKINQNLFELLIDGNTIRTIATISSDRPGRTMKDVIIYYECFGDYDCSINEVK